MNKTGNLHRLFSSNFYIDQQYALSFLPLAFSVMTGKVEMTTPDLETQTKAVLNENDRSASDKSVAVVSIKQPIVKYSDWNFVGSKTYIRILKSLEAREDIAGVVLDIDSGGGQSYGTPEFYDVVRSLSKPVVTYTDGYLCSAAYYIGSASNHIIANKRAEAIGSIGAYTQFVDFSGIFEKLGAKKYQVYATESTEKNKEIRALLDENDATSYVKNILDPLVSTFRADMEAVRPGMDESVYKGDSFPATKAKELGLVDELGTMETAIAKVLELSNSNNFNSNNSEMSKEKTFPKLAAVLGQEDVEAKKAHIFSATETVSLTAEQLSMIETALSEPEDGSKLTELQQQLTASNEAKTTAENKVNALETAVNTAIETNELTAEKKATTVENIALLSAKVAEYGALDGGQLTGVPAKADKSVTDAVFVDEIAKELNVENI